MIDLMKSNSANSKLSLSSTNRILPGSLKKVNESRTRSEELMIRQQLK